MTNHKKNVSSPSIGVSSMALHSDASLLPQGPSGLSVAAAHDGGQPLSIDPDPDPVNTPCLTDRAIPAASASVLRASRHLSVSPFCTPTPLTPPPTVAPSVPALAAMRLLLPSRLRRFRSESTAGTFLAPPLAPPPASAARRREGDESGTLSPPLPPKRPPLVSAVRKLAEDSVAGILGGTPFPPAADPLVSMLLRLRQESTLGNLEPRRGAPDAWEMLARSLKKKEVVDMARDDRMDTRLCRRSMCRCHRFVSSFRTWWREEASRVTLLRLVGDNYDPNT